MGNASVSTDKRGGWAAVAFGVLTLLAFFLVEAPPDFDATGDEVKAYLLENRSGGLGQLLVYSLTLPLLIVFLEALRRRFSSQAELAPVAAVAARAGGLFYLAAVVATAMFFAPAWNEDTAVSISADSMLLLWNTGYLVYLAVFPTAALLLAATTWCAARSDAFPTWYTWLTGVVAVLVLLAAIGVTEQGIASLSFAAFMVFVGWVILNGILLLRAPVAAAEG